MKKAVWGPVAAVVALFLLGAGQAYAQSSATNLNYNEIGLDLSAVQTRGADHQTFHGTGLSGRYLLNDTWFVTGTLDRVSNKTNALAYKDVHQGAGLGARFGLSANTDLVATLQYTRTNETISTKPRTYTYENAYGVGIRSLVTSDLELNASVNSHQPKEGGSYVYYNTGVGLHLSKDWVLRGSYSNHKYAGVKTDSYTVSVGYKF
jgi:hypothetical protein